MNRKKENKFEKIEESLKRIQNRINSYKKVDATVSNCTLSLTEFALNVADEYLEKGFVFDSCEEIEKLIND